MKHSFHFVALLLIIMTSQSCIKSEDPCHGAKHSKADFYMEEVCSVCGLQWQDYRTNVSSGSYIRFTSTNDSTIDFEWHIGAGVYHGHKFELNFSTATNGAVIPVMLIVIQKPNPSCIPNDNGTDTVIKNLRIDNRTVLPFGKWQGSFDGNTSSISIVNIQKYWSPIDADTFFYVSNLEPHYDSIVGSVHSGQVTMRQELPFEIDGNGTYNFFGAALTDSLGMNIVINYQYLDPPTYTNIIKKQFKGRRI